ncbi:MAG: beta-propeller fold lactonase family protein [Polyangiaceae bacterium]
MQPIRIVAGLLFAWSSIGCSSTDDAVGGDPDGSTPPVDGAAVSDAQGPAAEGGDAGDATAAPKGPLFAYASGYGPNIARFAVDPLTGALTSKATFPSFGSSPSFLAVSRDAKNLYALNEGSAGRVGAYTIDPASGALTYLNDVSSGGNGPAHVSVDATGKYVLVANGAHIATLAGAGPRHLAFHPAGKLAFLINEKNSTLTAFTLDGTSGLLSPVETKSTLPAGFSGSNTGAEVWVHPGGGFVYVSNRGDDSIGVFAIDGATGTMTLRGHTKTGGTTPRDFTIDPTGTFLYAANQGSSTVVPFRIDPTQGTLSPVAAQVSVPAVSFVGIVRLPP